jgi:diguanylate cyclase (GGDEF)-like protein
VFEVLFFAGWLLPIINILCFVLNICDPMTLLPVTHVYFVLGTVIALIYSIKGARKSTTAKLMILSTSILLVFTAAGLAAFYVAPSKGYDAAIFGIGLTLYFFSLLGIIMHKMVRLVEEEKYITTYKAMAFNDMLTGLNNRQSFERFFDNIEEQNVEDKSVTLVMFDLNYLKVVNDKHGHQAGDKLLVGLGKCLNKTFEGVGEAYRLGGDEFAAIVVGHAGEILNILDRLKGYIDEYNRLNEHRLSTAIGYSTGKYRSGDVDFYIRLFREADDMMYANKIRCHKEDGVEMRDKRT